MSEASPAPHDKQRDNQLLLGLAGSAGRSARGGRTAAVLAESLEPVELHAWQVLQEPGAPVQHVYFPGTALLGVVAVLADGPGAEVMGVGNEGAAGLAGVLPDRRSPHRVVCRLPGSAQRLPVEVLLGLLESDPAARRLLELHNQAAVALLAQRVACRQRHSGQQRLATWLLLCADRLGTASLPVTQHLLADMLGMRRTTLSEVAGAVQQTGAIRSGYGRIEIEDRRRLEDLACGCLDVHRRVGRLLVSPGPAAHGS